MKENNDTKMKTSKNIKKQVKLILVENPPCTNRPSTNYNFILNEKIYGRFNESAIENCSSSHATDHHDIETNNAK